MVIKKTKEFTQTEREILKKISKYSSFRIDTENLNLQMSLDKENIVRAKFHKILYLEEQTLKLIAVSSHPSIYKLSIQTIPGSYPNTTMKFTALKDAIKLQSKYKDSTQKYFFQIMSGPTIKLKSLYSIESLIFGASLKYDVSKLSPSNIDLTLIHYGWAKTVFKYFSNQKYPHNFRAFGLKETKDFTFSAKLCCSKDFFYSFGMTWAVNLDATLKLAFSSKIGPFVQVRSYLTPNLQVLLNYSNSASFSFIWSG